MKKKVALFFGGRSMESEISVITALQTLGAVDKSKYVVEPIYLRDGDMYIGGLDDVDAFKRFDPAAHKKAFILDGAIFEMRRGKLKRVMRPDVALICCHGGEGEGGVLQGLLEYNGVKYTSCSVLASSLLLDKAMSKKAFESLLINVLPHEEVDKCEYDAFPEAVAERIEGALSYPVIVKPNRLGSSIGISSAHDREELNSALALAFEFDSTAVVERMLTRFKEVNCAAMKMGGKIVVSSTEEPFSSKDFLSFEDKYMSNGKLSGARHVIPADIGATELIVKAITERLYCELRLDGVARIDFLIDEESGVVYVNEINTVPGSLAFYLFERQGISHRDLISALIENASTKEPVFKATYGTRVLESFKGGVKTRGCKQP